MAVFCAEDYSTKQDILYEMFGGEDVARAYRKINRDRVSHKLPTFEILIPKPKKITEIAVASSNPPTKESTGNVCVCGNILDADCHAKCKHCGFQNS